MSGAGMLLVRWKRLERVAPRTELVAAGGVSTRTSPQPAGDRVSCYRVRSSFTTPSGLNTLVSHRL